MAYSYNEVGAISPGQGITVPFKFLDRDHVSVLVDGVVTDKYSWLNNGMIQATSGFPSGTVTRVERNTPVALLKAVLEGTAVFDFEGVNSNFNLLLFILQEYADKEDGRNEQIDVVMEGFGQIATAVEAAQQAAETAADDAAAGALAAIEGLLLEIQLARNAAQLAQQKAEEAQEDAEQSAEAAQTFNPANYYLKTEADTRYAPADETYSKTEVYSKTESYSKEETDQKVQAGGVPIGASIQWNSLTLPPGFMKENGAAISRAAYPEIDAALYVGDAANATAEACYRCTNPASPSTSRSTAGTHFVLPEMRGEFARGLDDGRGVDPGRVLHSSQSSQNLAHSHTGTADSAGAHTHPVAGGGTEGGGSSNPLIRTTTSNSANSVSGAATSSGAHGHNLTIANSGGTEARPRSKAKLWIIRVF